MSQRLLNVSTLLCLGIVAAGPAYGDLIVNGNFEAGNTGFTSEYTDSPGDLRNDTFYDILKNASTAHPLGVSFGDHTTGSGFMMAVNGSVMGNDTVWTETVAVSPNADHDFSTWIATWIAQPPARLQFFINGDSLGTITAPVAAGVWMEFAATWNSGSNSSATIRIVDLNTQGSGNDFALDDISLRGPAAVPEPSSLASIGLGLAGLAGYAGWRRVRPRRSS